MDEAKVFLESLSLPTGESVAPSQSQEVNDQILVHNILIPSARGLAKHLYDLTGYVSDARGSIQLHQWGGSVDAVRPRYKLGLPAIPWYSLEYGKPTPEGFGHLDALALFGAIGLHEVEHILHTRWHWEKYQTTPRINWSGPCDYLEFATATLTTSFLEDRHAFNAYSAWADKWGINELGAIRQHDPETRVREIFKFCNQVIHREYKDEIKEATKARETEKDIFLYCGN